MPDLRPFRGLRYASARVPDLSAVLCPPYDVISPAQRDQLLSRDPHNAVRMELPSATPVSATDADFDAAATTLSLWLADGMLVRDERPMVYFYEQHYTANDGTPRVARSFFCELCLEDYGPDSGVRPHEQTLGPAKEHRFRLLSATRTHLSPVLLIYEADTTAVFEQLMSTASTREAIGPDGTHQRLWAIDPDAAPAARELLAVVGKSPLTIADGHHRYETALRYRDTPDAPSGADHVLALLYQADSDGLALAPWHRVIRGVDAPTAAIAAATEIFGTRQIATSGELIATIEESELTGVLGMWTRAGGAVLMVNRDLAQPFVSTTASVTLRWLDVSVLSGTLSRMIGASETELTAQGRLSYTHDARQAVRAVDSKEADVAFILRPTPVDQVLAIAAAGEFMPAKSTYFYPKAATGLVFDPLF